MVFILLFSIVW